MRAPELGGDMQRRAFITLLGGATAAWPLSVRAQQPAIPVIGFLNGASPDGYTSMVAAFGQGLKEAGYVEGLNVTVEYRWANGKYDQLPALAADLVRRPVSVIAATGTAASLVAKAATSTIPIVFTTGGDPVQLGLVARLNRPGGNITGVTGLTGEVAPKRLELARELFPGATVIGLLVNPRNPNVETLKRNSIAAAATLGLRLDILQASTEPEVDEALAILAQKRVSAVVIGPDAFFNSHPEILAATALRHSVPAIYEFRQFAAAGGLISYGGNIADTYRLAGVYVGRILKGDKPAELPVPQSTKIELIINLKTAKSLGVTVPQSLLGRADEVIE
jgi:putative tryptophan/tyrosine transport system substrate-binding protein